MLFIPTVLQLNGKTNKCPFPGRTHKYPRVSRKTIPARVAAALPGRVSNTLEIRLHFETSSRWIKEEDVKGATPLKKLKL